MSASEASKPYIDATERSIELNFRSLEYQNDRLNKVTPPPHNTTHPTSAPQQTTTTYPHTIARTRRPLTPPHSLKTLSARPSVHPCRLCHAMSESCISEYGR